MAEERTELGEPACTGGPPSGTEPSVVAFSALTLATRDMARSLAFYRALGFRLAYGGETAGFSSFRVGRTYLNLIAVPPETLLRWWGRAIFYVSDVDAFHARVLAAGLRPEFAPVDAPWGERYFHILDPDGHELSFAVPLAR
jgi:catechol 2,3-dioxygenase-like lactoylglutathione lyase family enzyme